MGHSLYFQHTPLCLEGIILLHKYNEMDVNMYPSYLLKNSNFGNIYNILNFIFKCLTYLVNISKVFFGWANLFSN